jgi:hypothetical protein
MGFVAVRVDDLGWSFAERPVRLKVLVFTVAAVWFLVEKRWTAACKLREAGPD